MILADGLTPMSGCFIYVLLYISLWLCYVPPPHFPKYGYQTPQIEMFPGDIFGYMFFNVLSSYYKMEVILYAWESGWKPHWQGASVNNVAFIKKILTRLISLNFDSKIYPWDLWRTTLIYQTCMTWKDRNQFHKVEVKHMDNLSNIPVKMLPTMGSLTRFIIDLPLFIFSINIFSR